MDVSKGRGKEVKEGVSLGHMPSMILQVRCNLLQTSGLRSLVTGWPLPTGAFVKSSSSFSGQQDRRLATLAVSITDPPPTARNPSNWFLRAKEMASSKLDVHA